MTISALLMGCVHVWSPFAIAWNVRSALLDIWLDSAPTAMARTSYLMFVVPPKNARRIVPAGRDQSSADGDGEMVMTCEVSRAAYGRGYSAASEEVVLMRHPAASDRSA